MDSDCGSSSAVLVKDIEALNKEGALVQVAQFNTCTADDSWNIVSNYLPVIDNSITVPHHQNHDTTGLNFAAGYSHFDNYNVRYPSDQTAKENTPAYSGQSCLQYNSKKPNVIYLSQSTPSIKQHFVPGNSRQPHDNHIFSNKQNNVRVEVYPRESEEQPCKNFTGIPSGVFMLLQPPIRILQPSSEQGNVNINFERRNNTSDIHPIQPRQEITSIQSNKGQILMEQHSKAPLSEIPMIYSSNSIVRNSHQDRISVSEQQSVMLHRTVQNGSYASTVLHRNDSEEGALGTDQKKDSTNFAVMNNIDNKNIKQKTEQKFYCRICEKFFSSLWDLQLHWNAEHAEDTLLCGICNRQFATLPPLRKHISGHRKLLYVCELCEFSTFQKNRLSSHRAKHLKETPFVCDKCREPFTRQNHLTAHLRRYHHFH